MSLENVQRDRQLFGEDRIYIGYPDKERQGSYFEFSEMYGIYSKSKVKEKAWEFLRFVMMEETTKIIQQRVTTYVNEQR